MSPDPYRYFRIEAHELLDALTQGVLAGAKSEASADALKELFRLAHTLKGAARVVGQVEIGELAHAIEDTLGSLRDSGLTLTPTVIEPTLARLDRVRELLKALDQPLPREPGERAPEPGPSPDALRSVRIPIAELEAVLEGVLEARAAGQRLDAAHAELARAAREARDLGLRLAPTSGAPHNARAHRDASDLAHRLEALERRAAADAQTLRTELTGLHELMARLRLVPVAELFVELERGVHDAAQMMGRQVRFELTGGEVAVDADVLASLRGPLRHLALNAVAHGIEDGPTRAHLRKPAVGTVRFGVSRRGHQVVFSCADDGAGFDVESIREQVLREGAMNPERARAASTDELVQALLRGGVSTAGGVTAVAGRGVGLDAVRQAVEDLNGQVEVHSQAGVGSTVALVVPVTLSAMPTLRLEVAGRVALLPLDSVRRATSIEPGDIARAGGREQVVVDGEAVGFFRLADLLGLEASRRSEPVRQSAVLVQTVQGAVALGVDAVRGLQHVVVRPLPDHVDPDPIIAGAALGDGGALHLVLAPSVLVDAARQPSRSHGHRVPSSPLPVLVIDDSLTTRMLEQSILESAGYPVDIASSGEEGLERARERRYGAFIVDVEMPGMSGFEFVAATRADPHLRSVPSILVTSLSTAEDKRRGKDVGARAYIVKSEFDQKVLLDTIRRLVDPS